MRPNQMFYPGMRGRQAPPGGMINLAQLQRERTMRFQQQQQHIQPKQQQQQQQQPNNTNFSQAIVIQPTSPNAPYPNNGQPTGGLLFTFEFNQFTLKKLVSLRFLYKDELT